MTSGKSTPVGNAEQLRAHARSLAAQFAVRARFFRQLLNSVVQKTGDVKAWFDKTIALVPQIPGYAGDTSLDEAGFDVWAWAFLEAGVSAVYAGI